MTKMHRNELKIDETMIRQLLQKQRPQWANLPLRAITSNGTDNALYRLGDAYIVRLPRIDWAVESINKEYQWLPRIAKCLNTAISEPVFKGIPDPHYPWPWLINKWNEGNNPTSENEYEYAALAKELADFLNALHNIKLSDGPLSRRGAPLKDCDADTKNAIVELKSEIDVPKIASLWEQLSNTSSWNQAAVWIHGDFLPGNILTQDNRLSAVIDFSDVGVGDPACDLIIAWALLNAPSRKVFKENLKYIDRDTWKRGKGWALSIALIILPYYKHSNPVLTTLAKRMIDSVLCDSE